MGEKTDLVDRMTARPFEYVRVPAGEFLAARIDREIPRGGSVATYWYAHGIGLIRLDDDMKLKSFTPRKD